MLRNEPEYPCTKHPASGAIGRATVAMTANTRAMDRDTAAGETNTAAMMAACPPLDGLAVARGEAFYARPDS